MDLFQQSGEAMLLAQQGQRELALMMAAKIRAWWNDLREWHARMPATLPPTEAQPR